MEKTKNILITGGSGVIGRRLTTLLLEKGYRVSYLGRSKRKGALTSYVWDPSRGTIDEAALADADVIVHLAGAGIADKRWNEKWKHEILFSRTATTRLLYEGLTRVPHRVRTFISASGISYYGLEDRDRSFVETDPPASDFMAGVTVAWERAVDEVAALGIRVVKLRTGVVLSRGGGALQRLATPVKFFVGAPLGSGEQYVSWIHLDDLCRLYLRAIEDTSMEGVFNAVAPHPVTNRELTSTIAKVLGRPLWLPPVPGFVVRLIAGEVAEVVLNGSKISCNKLAAAGFRFEFETVEEAVKDLLMEHKT